jgi:hypothetical protein
MHIKNIALSVVIIILTIFVTVYGINTFYSRPQYDNFCGEVQSPQIIEDASTCESIGGKWSNYDAPVKGEFNGYCDREYTCRTNYDNAMEKWRQNVFFIGLPLGIIIILIGVFVFNLEFVGAGLTFGGIGTILYSAWGFFWESADWVRFVISLVALAIIIFFAYWYNRKSFISKKVVKKKSTPKKRK